MKSLITYLSTLIILIMSGSEGNSQGLSAKEIVNKSYRLMEGESNYAEVKMTIHRPKWERTITFKSWMKGDDYSLIYITSPAKEEGQVFLKRGNEMWNWVPSIDRMIKIPPSMMMQSWMGSDLTNNDLVNESSIIDDYDHKIIDSENIRGHDCYKIELVPHEDAPVVWGRIISWISKENFYTLRNEYYDEDDDLKNIETLSEIKDVGGRTIPTKFVTVPSDKEGYRTTLIFEKIRFNIDIEDSFFSIQNMKRVR